VSVGSGKLTLPTKETTMALPLYLFTAGTPVQLTDPTSSIDGLPEITPSTIGRIIGRTPGDADRDGVLVDWGTGDPARMAVGDVREAYTEYAFTVTIGWFGPTFDVQSQVQDALDKVFSEERTDTNVRVVATSQRPVAK